MFNQLKYSSTEFYLIVKHGFTKLNAKNPANIDVFGGWVDGADL